MAVSKKEVEERLAHYYNYEGLPRIAQEKGIIYVQVDSMMTWAGAKRAVARLHAMGYRAKALKNDGWTKVFWMVYAAHRPKRGNYDN